MFATIRSRPLRLLALVATALPCAVAPVAAAAGPVEGPTPVRVSSSSSAPIVDPQLAVDPGDPSRRVVAATLADPASPGVAVATRAASGAWSWITHQDTPGGPQLDGLGSTIASGGKAVGRPDVSWGGAGTDRVVLYTRAEVASGACSPGSGIYNSLSSDAGASWTPLDLASIFEDGPTSWSGTDPVKLDQPSSTRAVSFRIVTYVATRYADRNDCADDANPVESRLGMRITNSSSPGSSDEFIVAAPSGAISDPTVIADPTAPGSLAVFVGWAEQKGDGTWQVVVRRCVDPDATAPAWTCTPVGGALGPFAATSDHSALMPSFAVSGTPGDAAATVHLAVGIGGAQADDAVYARAAPSGSGWAWSTPVSVGTGSAIAQILPQVTVAPNGRADVVFLDASGSPLGYRPFQVSIAPDGTRGQPVMLGDRLAAPLTPDSFGSRIAAASLGEQGGTTGVVAAVVAGGRPAGNPSTWSSLYELRLKHGTTAPALASTSAATAGKQSPLQLASSLVVADADGDPVGVTAGQPQHGSVNGLTYTSQACFAGNDTVPVTLRELPTGQAVQTSRVVAITNLQPTFTNPATRLAINVPEGGHTTVQLPVQDGDAGDTYTAVSVDNTTPGVHFAIAPSGVLTVTADAHSRPGPAPRTIKVADCSPAGTPNRISLEQPVRITVMPTFGALTTRALTATTTGSFVGVALTAVDSDWDSDEKTLPVHYTIDWNTASTTDKLTQVNAESLTDPNAAFASHVYPLPGTYEWRVTASRVRSTGVQTSVVASHTLKIREQVSRLIRANVTSMGRAVKITLWRRSATTQMFKVGLTIGRQKASDTRSVAIPAGKNFVSVVLPLRKGVTARSAVASITLQSPPPWGVQPLAVTFGLR